jgi:hypothetical protein
VKYFFFSFFDYSNLAIQLKRDFLCSMKRQLPWLVRRVASYGFMAYGSGCIFVVFGVIDVVC